MCERQNRIYAILVSGVQVSRLMRYVNGFKLNCFLMIRKQQW